MVRTLDSLLYSNWLISGPTSMQCKLNTRVVLAAGACVTA
jgi:hypothetical protein